MEHSATFHDAVTIVRNKLSPDSARLIQYSLERSEKERGTLHGAGFGVAIRNLLAENGIVWEEAILFSVWLAILKEAIKTML
jgi:hypothetical protein